MKSVSASSETGSWESVPVFNQRNEMDLFLAHERSFGCDESGIRPSTASSSKPCFIDASSLLDESDLIFTPPPSVTHKMYSLNSSQLQHFEDGLNEEPQVKHFNNQPEDCSDIENDSPAKVYDIKDQFSANEPVAQKSMSSSGSSTNYSSRLQSDTESLVYPDTPFNSIIQVARQLRVCENNDDLDGRINARRANSVHEDNERSLSSPMRIPKRQKHDESAPILSGGASIKDFTPKQCESPSTRRRNENCPIISGGSVDIEEVVKKIKKPTLEQLKLSSSVTSWIVDFNELHIEEKEDDTTQQPKSLDYSSTSQKNGMGFYVDFNSLKTPEDEMKKFLEKKKLEAKNMDEKTRKKSTGFYVDFSDSCPDTPKGIETPPTVMPKNRTSFVDKKNVSMFINFNEDVNNSAPGIMTDGILSNEESQASSTDTEDVTFQNPESEETAQGLRQDLTISDYKSKMETIPESSENSPFKKATSLMKNPSAVAVVPVKHESEFKIETHTMESLQAVIEKQKQILENETELSSISFVKLSDLDKPSVAQKFDLHASHSSTANNDQYMSNSTGSRGGVPRFNEHHGGHRSLTSHPWSMSRSTGNNNIVNLASSVENSKSLSRLFPHLSKAFSNSVPNDVGFNSGHSPNDYSDLIASDYSCTSSVTSSRSGMDSVDESSISCRQPRRLGEDLLKMFLQEIATDVTLEVGNRKMRAHKCILRSRCQYFAAVLAGNWVQSSGNVIMFPGYSYSAVHFALCHIYSGASHPPEGISLMELASLSDLLGLEGLKEVTSYALKTNYCHNFHKPCSGCVDGILQVLPLTLNHGLDDLYRKCLKWVCRHFLKVWQTRQFAQLPPDLHGRCRQQIVAHLTSENVLNMVLDCEQILNSLDQCRWNIVNVDNLVRDILDASHGYIMDHFASLIASDSFLSLGHGQNYTISRLEHLLLKTASALTPDQACRSYPRSVRLNQLLTAKIIKMPNPLSNENLKSLDRNYDSIQLRHEEDEMDWNEEFVRLVSALLSAVEQCLIRQCSRAMRANAWQRMDVDLRMKIQKLACLSEPVEDVRKLRSSTSSMNSLRNYPSQSSSQSSRTNDLRQVKLAIQAHTKKTQMYEQYYKSNNFQGPAPVVAESNIPVIKRTIEKSASAVMHPKPAARKSELNRITKSSTQSHVPEPIKAAKLTHKRSQSDDLSTTEIKPKLIPIKARYMEPRKPRTPLMDQKSNNRLQLKGKNISSSESSTRTSSPAFNRKRQSGVSKNPAKASNLSLDSLSSPAKQRNSLMSRNKVDNMELSMDSLVDSMRSSFKTEKTVSQESLGRKILDDSSKLGKVHVENKLKKIDLKAKLSLDSNKQKLDANKQQFNHNNQIRRSFLSQKSKEILARKAVSGSDKDSKQSPTSNSSLTTKSTKSSSPKQSDINKSSSSSSIQQQKKKVFSTTLHLRKTATMSEPASVAVAAVKMHKISKSVSSNKVVANVKAKKDEIVTTKKVIVNSKIAKASGKSPMQVQPIIQTIAPIAKEEIVVEFESKLARSNTFCIDENTSELLGLH
ncbi:unnamed protein product [Diamesa serratosioi]